MPRELIDPGTDKRYVRRDDKGQFKESDDVGRSHAQDQARHSTTRPEKGEGDKGDRRLSVPSRCRLEPPSSTKCQ